MLKSPSSVFSVHQRSFYTFLVLSHSLKSGLHSLPHPRGIYFQKHGLRSGPFGLISHSNRILSKNKEEMQNVLDHYSERIEKLTHLLGCQKSQVVWMVTKDTRIVTSFSQAKVQAIIKLLLNYGFSADSIIRYQSVFCWSIPTLQNRIEGLLPYRKYQFSIHHVIYPKHVYDSTVKMLKKEVDLMGSHPSRISYLTELLNCEEDDIHEAIALGHRHLEHYKLSRLKTMVNLLVNHGISTKDIMANLHILQVEPLLCKYRLKQMTSAGDFSKEKMLQTLIQNKSQYQIMFDFHRSNVQALGDHEDKYAFLQSRLQCSQQQLDLLLLRAPTIKSITPRRIKVILDILLDEFKFTPTTILKNHHLLFFSAKRLRNRWKVLSEYPLPESQLITDLIIPEVKFIEKYRHSLENTEK